MMGSPDGDEETNCGAVRTHNMPQVAEPCGLLKGGFHGPFQLPNPVDRQARCPLQRWTSSARLGIGLRWTLALLDGFSYGLSIYGDGCLLAP